MKVFIILSLFFLSTRYSSGQDFSCPDEVNLGDFNIIAKTDSSSNFTISYTPYFYIYKTTNDEIFFQDGIVKPLYDSSIVKNGNYLNFINVTNKKDTFKVDFRLNYKYLDSISTLGEFLEYKFTFFYLKQGYDFLDSQNVKIKLKLKSEKAIYIGIEKRPNFIYRSSNKYGDSSITDFNFGYLLNFMDNDFIVDSIKQKIDGINFFDFYLVSLDSITFPYKLKSKNIITYRHLFHFLKPEIGKSIISFYGHFENDNQSIVLNDTNQIAFEISDGIFYYISTMKYYHTIYAVDTVKMPTITISNNTDSLLKFISFNIISSSGLLAYYQKEDVEPPFDINPRKKFSLKEIYLHADNPGKYKLKVSMNFEKENTEKFTKDIDLIIEVLRKETTDLTIKEYKYEFIVSPNPATDYIVVDIPPLERGLGSVAPVVRVFDVLGVPVNTPPVPLFLEGESLKLDVSHLPPGAYFVQSGSRVSRFVKL